MRNGGARGGAWCDGQGVRIRLACLLQEFSEDGQSPLHHATVGRVRDAFADIIVEHNRADREVFSERARHGFILVRHLHDEATMRMRSLLTASKFTGHVARQPSALSSWPLQRLS